MSRIGKKPVSIPQGIKVDIKDRVLTVKGPKGELSINIHPDIDVKIENEEITVTRKSDEKRVRALHGLHRALINNLVIGVKDGFTKKLEIVGVGYRAEMKGNKLQLSLGYSHPILFVPPADIKVEAPTPNNIVVSGINKELVGMVAAKIRSFRPPEPYKGKGIKYEGEIIRRKAGKAASKSLK
ncbi:MAG TPA: 50S ribosomal protein L6 [Bacteroidota bacterium]|nr:50S ribosomal protein L6 [Bacteroidota bacterium]